jgi:enoyl-CoA hydratase/carnithine racemase
MSSYPLVRVVHHADGVLEVVLDRPDALNALSMAMLQSFGHAVEQVRRAPCAVLVVSSACERAFSVGADVKERGAMSPEDIAVARPEMLRAYRSLDRVEQPVIGAVHGFALGGGLELALGCDILVCEADAILGLPEVTLGIIPGAGGTQLLARRAGWGVACDLIFTGRRISGSEAQALRVVDRVVSAPARESGLDLARQIALSSPSAIRLAKRALVRGVRRGLADALAHEDEAFHQALFDADRAEGVAAHRERRRPQWPSGPSA